MQEECLAQGLAHIWLLSQLLIITAGRATHRWPEKPLWFWVLLRFSCPSLPLPPLNTEERNPCHIQQHPLPGRWHHHSWPQHQSQLCMFLPAGHESQLEDLPAANGQVWPERVPSAPGHLYPHKHLTTRSSASLLTASHKLLGGGEGAGRQYFQWRSPVWKKGPQNQIQALSHTNQMYFFPALEIDSPTLAVSLLTCEMDLKVLVLPFLEAQKCLAYVN